MALLRHGRGRLLTRTARFFASDGNLPVRPRIASTHERDASGT
jgi:hypothetical protein